MGVGDIPQLLVVEVQHAVAVAAGYESGYQGPEEVDDDDDHVARLILPLGGVETHVILLAWEHMVAAGCRSTHAPLHVHTAGPHSTRARAHVPPGLHDGAYHERLTVVEIPASRQCFVASESPQTQEWALHRSVLHDENSLVPPRDGTLSRSSLRTASFAMDGFQWMEPHGSLVGSHAWNGALKQSHEVLSTPARELV